MPTDITIWDWAFDSPASPLGKYNESELAGYLDAATGDRVNWKQVKEASTYISTALVKKYGYKPGETLSLFSRNTIWYPVTMLGALRAGMDVGWIHILKRNSIADKLYDRRYGVWRVPCLQC